MQSMSLTSFSREIKSITLLTREEELACARRAVSGDGEARNRLIRANLRFVVGLARKYAYSGLPVEDLVDEGCIGLIRAVERFDPEKGYHFLSYAVWWIRQAMLRAIAQHSRLIRLPSNKVKELALLDRIRHEKLKEDGNEPDAAYLAEQLHEDAHGMDELLALSQKIVSLDTAMDHSFGESPLGESVQDHRQSSIDDAVCEECLKDDINTLFAALSPREAEILRDRFGLEGDRSKSLEEVGRKHKLTKERIRQIEQRALRKLRYSTAGQRLRSYL